MAAKQVTYSDSARQALRAYAHDLGLAFQIIHDLLDVEGTEAWLRELWTWEMPHVKSDSP